MKTKKLALVALAACSVFGVASCNDNPAESSKGTNTVPSSVAGAESSTKFELPALTQKDPGSKGQYLDIMINYKKSDSLSYGVSYTGEKAYNNKFDKKTYQNGTILPTWKEFATKLNVEIRDVADYSVHTDDDQYKKVYSSVTDESKRFVSKVTSEGSTNGQDATVDLWMNSAKNMNNVASQGGLVNLLEYLDHMPNFKAWLQANPDTVKQLLTGDNYDELYVAPYFDGKDEIEKMIMMDTDTVKKLLDGNPTYDTATSLPGTAYTPFINYGKDEKIEVVGPNGKADTITVNVSENVIAKQNALATKNGATLTGALKEYLNATYKEYIGEGKLYENLSDIFISKNACYNVDELVALMRCVKTNPRLITGSADKNVTVLSPREDKDSRANNVVQFAQVWGIQGLTAETDFLYFDAEGELHDARTTEATYTVGLANLNKLYKEGLIVENYATAVNAGKYNYAKELIKNSQLFMLYDYIATTAQYNQKDANGIGEDNSKTTGFRPVLAPVTKWEQDTAKHAQGFNFTRHTEDNRTVKSGGWVIPKKSDNLAGALELVDYIFTEEGADLQNFGPSAYRDGDKRMTLADGTTCPVINPDVLADISSGEFKSLGWNNWYRCLVGSTHGIGHIRSNGLALQVTNSYGNAGFNNVLDAISTGVMSLAKTTGANGFNKSVPTFFGLTSQESTALKNNADNNYFIALWKSEMAYTGYHGIVKDGLTNDKLNEIKSHFENQNKAYLETYKLYV